MAGSWQLPAIRPSTYATPADLASRRAAAGSAPLSSSAEGVGVRSALYGGVPCVVCEPPAPTGTTVYLHGGGYRLGSAQRSAPFATRLARSTSRAVVVVDYRLAPEHPFPAGLHDVVAVYRQLLEAGAAGPAVAGDSAGGGLAAAVVVAAAKAGAPLPEALVLMSPWLDLTCTSPTFASRAASDDLFSLAAARQASEMYLQGHDPLDPLASPLHARLTRWPRTMVMTSTDEVLLQDSLTFVATLALSGVPVTATFERGVPHAWPAVFPDLPQSIGALASVGEFVTGRVAP